MTAPKKTTKRATAPSHDDRHERQFRPGLNEVSLQSFGTHMLFEEITQESVREASEFIIKSNYILPRSETLTLMINSEGGDVYSGFALIDVMKSSGLKIQTVGCGLIASMGAMIFIAGSPGLRVMTKNSFIMTHQFYDYMEGKYHELVASRGHQDALHELFMKHIVANTKMSEAQVRDRLLKHSDEWIGADEALKIGMCDKVVSVIA